MGVHAPQPREDADGHRGAYTRGDPWRFKRLPPRVPPSKRASE
jgi:hypothetical protein